MREFKMDKDVETLVEKMAKLGTEVAFIKKKHPKCWQIIRKHFDLGEYSNDETKDSHENMKLELYVQIVKAENIKTKKVEKKLEGEKVYNKVKN